MSANTAVERADDLQNPMYIIYLHVSSTKVVFFSSPVHYSMYCESLRPLCHTNVRDMLHLYLLQPTPERERQRGREYYTAVDHVGYPHGIGWCQESRVPTLADKTQEGTSMINGSSWCIRDTQNARVCCFLETTNTAAGDHVAFLVTHM